jgi:hypothetical protein
MEPTGLADGRRRVVFSETFDEQPKIKDARGEVGPLLTTACRKPIDINYPP